MAFMRLANFSTSMKKILAGTAVPNLNIKGGQFALVDGDNRKVVSEMDSDTKQIFVRVLIVDGNPNKCKVYYAGSYSEDEDSQVPPTCYSDDGIYPAANAQDKQCETCEQCPMNVWGSKVNDFGKQVKACNDYIKLAVVVPSFSLEKIFLFRVPPGSLKNFLAYATSFDDVDLGGGRKANLGDYATYIYFDPERANILKFAPGELEENEVGLSYRIQEEGAARNVIGLQNVQVENQLEAPTPKKSLPKPEPEVAEKQKPALGKGLPAPKAETKSKPDLLGTRTKGATTAPKFSGMNKPKPKVSLNSEEDASPPTAGIPKINMPVELQNMIGDVLGE